ncbi:tRNA (5-methylaminomethyl-2-thiouridylate)-methyltransferase [Cryptococcus amylolentus CBS 6039]|uniref:tRNA-5-taurinomethyluridine 2-sulfurtransferase n=1 Tax=Cryptococcus amylolentus CBS 6039 TaxID=1295533 RepID=A0A1E3HA88_9TREE|nr:tRNA (5-methylaminomethyl-2-thiouridylate)-methyltransferase [Cryptococcus amylolentus CBS 6039]ODN73065.1 tRNA (5-methylaminomethyl-2-thiouridylate)-methyltransferase [Cryptococcus amylolentus CBS 6039]
MSFSRVPSISPLHHIPTLFRCSPRANARHSNSNYRLSIRRSHTLSPNELKRLLPTMENLGLREGDHVTVGMSGGVDSATTLGILKDFPIHLDVIFMRNWDPLLSESSPDSDSPAPQTSLSYTPSSPSSTTPKTPNLSPCEWQRDYTDVLSVSSHLGVPEAKVRFVDLSKEYWSRVFEPAVGVWESGGTPNPDVDCNREIKFGALLDVLPKNDRHFLATGHYGRISHFPSSPSRLLRAADTSKDQTYYLSQMTEYQLSRTILPLGGLLKKDVRRLALHWDLPNAKKAESMGVCFIGERGKFGDFISQYTSPPPPGFFTTPSGTPLQQHKGLWHYTIGQKARLGGQKEVLFVAKKGVGREGQDIVVVPAGHPALLCSSVCTASFIWIHGGEEAKAIIKERPAGVMVQVRHRMEPTPAKVEFGENLSDVKVIFDPPLVGVSPGQVVGIWHEGWCLGSGVIESTECVDESVSSS